MSQDSTQDVMNCLVSECGKYFRRILQKCPESNMALDWDTPNCKFLECIVLSTNNQWATKDYIMSNISKDKDKAKSLAAITGGIDRYPKTASFLINILRSLEQKLQRTALSLEEPRAPRIINQPTPSLKDEELFGKLCKLHDAVVGSGMALFHVKDLVCPSKDAGLVEDFHVHCLAAFESGLSGTIQPK